MRLLFDENLSHRLVAEFSDLFPGSLHVRMVGLAQSDDLSIWEYAKAKDLVIVTQDSDYADWNKLRGAPPRIIWLRCGNARFEVMALKLRDAAARIELLADDERSSIVEIW